MRLCTTRPATRRAWTVELRPGSDGPRLVCQQCDHRGVLLAAVSARSAALEHLAGHARRDALPSYLRTCQCHERGCRWHPRHRGCAGPVHLLLARERSGRLWRLADACTACASVTAQAAVVPETFLPAAVASSDGASRRRKRRPEGPGDQIRVQEMLSYLAAALPSHTGAAARLLAVQCALRMDSEGKIRMPTGLLDRVVRAQVLDGGWLRTPAGASDAAASPDGVRSSIPGPARGRSAATRAASWEGRQAARSRASAARSSRSRAGGRRPPVSHQRTRRYRWFAKTPLLSFSTKHAARSR